MTLNKDEFEEWRQQPATTGFRDFLKAEANRLASMWANGLIPDEELMRSQIRAQVYLEIASLDWETVSERQGSE